MEEAVVDERHGIGPFIMARAYLRGRTKTKAERAMAAGVIDKRLGSAAQESTVDEGDDLLSRLDLAGAATAESDIYVQLEKLENLLQDLASKGAAAQARESACRLVMEAMTENYGLLALSAKRLQAAVSARVQAANADGSDLLLREAVQRELHVVLARLRR